MMVAAAAIRDARLGIRSSVGFSAMLNDTPTGSEGAKLKPATLQFPVLPLNQMKLSFQKQEKDKILVVIILYSRSVEELI